MFDGIDFWISEADRSTNINLVKILCGNKIDLYDKKVVSTEEGMLKAEENGMIFIETSALDGININELFELAANEVKKRFEDRLLKIGIKSSKITLAPQNLPTNDKNI